MLGTEQRLSRRNATNRRAAELAARATRLNAELAFFEEQRRSWDSDETDDAIRKLNQRCEAQANKLIAAHAAIPAREPSANAVTGHTRLAVLLSREEALKAELMQLQAGVTIDEVEVQPKGVASHTLEDILRSVSDIDVTIDQLVSQTTANNQRTEKEEALCADRQQLNDALEEELKLAAAEEPKDASLGEVQQLEEATASLHQMNKMLMSQLSLFLDRYYPSLGGESHEVKELLQDLMNRAVTRPDEPWLLLTSHNATPESVELLLRAGIAVKDEEDSRRVKLVQFF